MNLTESRLATARAIENRAQELFHITRYLKKHAQHPEHFKKQALKAGADCFDLAIDDAALYKLLELMNDHFFELSDLIIDLSYSLEHKTKCNIVCAQKTAEANRRPA